MSLAVRSRLRQSASQPVSPVIVQLSSRSATGNASFTGHESGSQVGGSKPLDPCSRDAVMYALKQKRKRWTCGGDEESAYGDREPVAKRSR